MSKEALKPCPFCGGEASFITRWDKDGYVGAIVCSFCDVELHTDEVCDYYEDANAKAIAAWNKRVKEDL